MFADTKVDGVKAMGEGPASFWPLPLPKYIPGQKDGVQEEGRNGLVITRGDLIEWVPGKKDRFMYHKSAKKKKKKKVAFKKAWLCWV